MLDVEMLQQILHIARDVAVILLALEGLVAGAIVFLVMHAILRGLRQLVPQTVRYIAKAQHAVALARHAIQRGATFVCAPFVWLNRASAQVRALANRLNAVFTGFSAKGR